jgi:hypothetical protein
MFGPFAGPNFCEVSLPKRSGEIANGLWQFSEKLCTDILNRSNVKVSFGSRKL